MRVPWVKVLAGGAALAVALLAACDLITGVSDLREAACVSGCTDAGPGQETGADGASDARFDSNAPDGCVCVPAVPPGWSLVAFDPQSRVPCPAGYGAGNDVLVDPDLGPLVCACTCSATSPPSCTTGTVAETWSDYPSCTDGGTNFVMVNGSGCNPFPFNVVSPYHLIPPLAVRGGACGSSPTRSTPDAGSAGRTCGGPASPGPACGGGVCAPLASPFVVCVTSAGELPCPTGYPNAHRSGTGVTDTRACTPCACGSLTADCASPSMTLYADTFCTSSPEPLVADGQCHPNDAGMIAGSFTYTATVANVNCPVSVSPSPTGSAALTNEATVCCP